MGRGERAPVEGRRRQAGAAVPGAGERGGDRRLPAFRLRPHQDRRQEGRHHHGVGERELGFRRCRRRRISSYPVRLHQDPEQAAQPHGGQPEHGPDSCLARAKSPAGLLSDLRGGGRFRARNRHGSVRGVPEERGAHAAAGDIRAAIEEGGRTGRLEEAVAQARRRHSHGSGEARTRHRRLHMGRRRPCLHSQAQHPPRRLGGSRDGNAGSRHGHPHDHVASGCRIARAANERDQDQDRRLRIIRRAAPRAVRPRSAASLRRRGRRPSTRSRSCMRPWRQG